MEDIDIVMGISVIDITKNKVEDTKNKVEDTKNFITKWKDTKEAYDKLDPKNQISDAQLQKEKAKLPQAIIDQVAEKVKGTDFKTDEFLKFYIIG
ncbi:MAG: hypothetical protein WCJ39_10790, partial [bacterium]